MRYFTRIDHYHMAFEVRELGPRLFERMIAVKRREDRTEGLSLRASRSFDRHSVLDQADVERAISSRVYMGRELAVLRYLSDHMRRIGEPVGIRFVGGRGHGCEHMYYVISLETIQSYDGSPITPQAKGNWILTMLAAFLGALCGFCVLPGLMQVVLGIQILLPWILILGSISAAAFAVFFGRIAYVGTVKGRTDHQAAQAMGTVLCT